jgi:hypothetical protein
MWKWLNHGANRCESVVRLDLPQRQWSSAQFLQCEEHYPSMSLVRRLTARTATRARRSDHERRPTIKGFALSRLIGLRAVAVQRLSVAISKRSHPIPFRTRKLSSSEPMVLLGRLSGRVGRRRDLLQRLAAHAASLFFFHLPEGRGCSPGRGPQWRLHSSQIPGAICSIRVPVGV